jgi:hypothetical protein
MSNGHLKDEYVGIQPSLDELSAQVARVRGHAAACTAIVDLLFPEGEDERKPQEKPKVAYRQYQDRGEVVVSDE